MPIKEDELLGPLVLGEIERIGAADILVGIPSFNNSRTIGHVVKAVSAGLAKHFSEYDAVIINSDGGSSDGTPDIVAATDFTSMETLMVRHRLHPVHKISTPYHGIPGKGSAFRTIFKIAQLLGVRACVVVDSDLRSITPEWIEMLVGPILNEGYDYAAPLYRRHKYDGTITNSIVYPLTRALYGKRIRQPIGGDFGFSGELATRYLAKDVWDTNVARYGIDIWMTTTALAEGFKLCQSFLGAKIHDAKDPGADLSAMLIQVVSSLFRIDGYVRTCVGNNQRLGGSPILWVRILCRIGAHQREHAAHGRQLPPERSRPRACLERHPSTGPFGPHSNSCRSRTA